jgi:hypothetical protein
MVEIHLYGKLRRYAPGNSPSSDSVIIVDPIEDELGLESASEGWRSYRFIRGRYGRAGCLIHREK